MFSIDCRPMVFLSRQRFSTLKSGVNCLFLSILFDLFSVVDIIGFLDAHVEWKIYELK